MATRQIMGRVIDNIPTSKSRQVLMFVQAHQRAPSDPYYYANVYVENMVVGSRWTLTYDNAGVRTELATGVNTNQNFTIENVPAYASQFLMRLDVRKSSETPKYEQFVTYTNHSQSDVTMYVVQSRNSVAE